MARIRIEYVRLRRGGDQGAMDADVIALVGGSAEVLMVGAVSVQSAPAPAFVDGAWNSGVHARIIGLSGAVVVEVGSAETADFAGGTLVRTGDDPVYLPIETGQTVAAVAIDGDGFEAFANPEATITRDAAGALTSIALTDGVETSTKTLIRNLDGSIATIGKWVAA